MPDGRNFPSAITWVPATFARLSSSLLTVINSLAHRRRLFDVAHHSPNMALPTSNPKDMTELTMLTFLIEAASAIRNKNGDRSIEGYVGNHGLTSRRMMESPETEVKFAVLDSIGDILLLNHQVIAITPDKQKPFITTVLVPDPNLEDELGFGVRAEDPISEAVSVSTISASVVPNANDCYNRKGGQLPVGGPLGNLSLVAEGKSMWKDVKKDPLCYALDIDVESPQGLANHAETLSDYLFEYGEEPPNRGIYSMSFSVYLLSACWKKLHRRFCSWQRLNLIRKFEERVDLLEAHLNLIGQSSGPKMTFLERGPGDHTLASFLKANPLIFTEMLPKALPDDMHPKPPPLVFDKLHQAVVRACDHNDLESLYTKETALGFHYLVYCVFLIAGNAIKKIKDHSTPLNLQGAKKGASYSSLVDDFKVHIKGAIFPMKFLQFVLSSTVFKRHIGVWTNDGECLDSLLPSWAEKRVDVIFGIKRGIQAASKKGPSPIEGGNGDGDTPNESPTGGGENDDASKESPSERCKDNDDDDDDDDVPERESGVTGLKTFFGWVRTFVAHFLGKRNLEVYTVQLSLASFNKRPEIRVLAVNSEQFRVPTWGEFQTVICNALANTTEEDKVKIITILTEKVSNGKGLAPDAYRHVSFLRSIITKERQDKTYNVIMHCEAVVVALLEFLTNPKSNLNDNNILAELSKNLANDMVSVSKLCCPVCWELFQVLGKEDIIRGCHTTVSPVVLPETLPSHVSDAMVTRFRAHLSTQLHRLLSPSYNVVSYPTTGHHRNSSDSGYSAVSNESAGKLSSLYGDWTKTQNAKKL